MWVVPCGCRGRSSPTRPPIGWTAPEKHPEVVAGGLRAHSVFSESSLREGEMRRMNDDGLMTRRTALGALGALGVVAAGGIVMGAPTTARAQGLGVEGSGQGRGEGVLRGRRL